MDFQKGRIHILTSRERNVHDQDRPPQRGRPHPVPGRQGGGGELQRGDPQVLQEGHRHGEAQEVVAQDVDQLARGVALLWGGKHAS